MMPPELIALGVVLLMFVSGFLWGRGSRRAPKVVVYQIGYMLRVAVDGELVYEGRIEEGELTDANDPR